MSLRNTLTRLGGSGALPPLPESFLFGVASADHQCEAYRQDREDIRDVWERDRKLKMRGRATDFENRFEEDVALARGLGCTAFRFSIAWSRVEPIPGQFNNQVFDYYRRLLEAIRAAGMEPIVTLHHFTWPPYVDMLADNFTAMFERYTSEVVNRLGQLAHYWITFNEPSQLIYGYIKPWWESNYFTPPGLPEGATLGDEIAALGKLIRNLFLAHKQARQLIRDANPDALVGSNPLLLGLPVWLQRWINKNATQMRGEDDLRNKLRRYATPGLTEQGEVDLVIATLTQTPDRERQVMFSEVYFVAGQRLLVKSSSTLREAQDLAGRVVAVVKSSTAERSLRLLPQAKALVVRDYAAALRALDSARADALLTDDTILQGLMVQHPNQYKLIGERLTTEPYAIAVAQGQGDLLDTVDLAVRRFKSSGAWAEAYTRHLAQPAPETPRNTLRAIPSVTSSQIAKRASQRVHQPGGSLPLAAPGTTLRRIQDRDYLIAAVKQDVPGLGYKNPITGELSGLEIDLARTIAEQILGDPTKVRFRPAATQERIPLLRSLVRFLNPLLKQYSILSTVLASNWWHLGMAGQLDEFLCPQECHSQQDFVGLDYYWGISTLRLDRIQRLAEAGLGRFDRAPVWPSALYGHLRYQANLFPDLPLLIVENGSVDVADGVDRSTYLRRHIEQVQRAVRDGVQVIGYVCWSLTSNREWGLPFDQSSDFGLYHIELDDDLELKRAPTPAVATYKEIIARRGV
jgi:beta-glucosidase/6-phospho-beta-glucosidase/beta-galactosidase/ABC-type amino acid transport substrate-binding protein